jgi:long-chain fatty acid transport protein
VGYNAGILWQPIKQISLGANFRSSANVTLNGQTHYERQLLIPSSHNPANMSLNFPWTAVGGISYRPTPKWNLEFDANYTDWSSFGTTTLHQHGSVPAVINQNIPVNLDWQGSWM